METDNSKKTQRAGPFTVAIVSTFSILCSLSKKTLHVFFTTNWAAKGWGWDLNQNLSNLEATGPVESLRS